MSDSGSNNETPQVSGKKGWRAWVPDPKTVIAHPWLRWLGPRLSHPRLWHINRRGIAMALSIGMFFGLLIPVMQIPLAGIAAVLLRANIAVAVCSTLITNPVTFAPIYYFAYQLGGLILGRDSLPAPPPQPPESTELSELTKLDIPDPGLFAWLAGWSDSIITAGAPLAVGLLTLAIVAGMSAYILVSWGWRIRTTWVRRQRRKRFRAIRAKVRAIAEEPVENMTRAEDSIESVIGQDLHESPAPRGVGPLPRKPDGPTLMSQAPQRH